MILTEFSDFVNKAANVLDAWLCTVTQIVSIQRT